MKPFTIITRYTVEEHFEIEAENADTALKDYIENGGAGREVDEFVIEGSTETFVLQQKEFSND
ncbi:MAG TPA: hypothetical protein VFW62_01750 [bacterium]|nr:hypothetical protein [bacterium]